MPQIKLRDGTLQVLWPDHCVRNTKGAEISPSLKCLSSDGRILKGTNSGVDSYSAFYDNVKGGSTGLSEILREAEVCQSWRRHAHGTRLFSTA